MVYKQKNSPYYYVKLQVGKNLVHRSTRKSKYREAKQVESEERLRLIREGKDAAVGRYRRGRLAVFLREEFLPWVDQRFETPSNTRVYYHYGAQHLAALIGSKELDTISDRDARYIESQMSKSKASTKNAVLRTLQRALSYAEEIGRIERRPRIRLAKGENSRTRVLSGSECKAYLKACPEPWKTAASIILGTGARPGEVRALRWEDVEWRRNGGIIHIRHGKTPAARRPLPMLPEVYKALNRHHDRLGSPATGLVFPSKVDPSRHWVQGTQNKWHHIALEASGVRSFPPYALRHTALTRFARHCDGFTLAAVAGHTTLQMTRRYVHPQEATIVQAFDRISRKGQSRKSE